MKTIDNGELADIKKTEILSTEYICDDLHLITKLFMVIFDTPRRTLLKAGTQ